MTPRCSVCSLPVTLNYRCTHGGTPYCLHERIAAEEAKVDALRAEVAKLRKAQETTFALTNEVYDAVCVSLGWAQCGPTNETALNVCLRGVKEILRQLDVAKDSLAVEAEACDVIRAVLRPDVLGCVPGSAPSVALDWCKKHDARRDAEKKCGGCDATRSSCEFWKTRGATKCCPDCEHPQ